MVHHIVLWNFKPELTPEERLAAGERIKEELEAVGAEVPGVLSLRVARNELPSGNKDLGLFSEFESVEALNNYQVHPAHVAASSYVKSVTCDRACLDY